MDKEWNAPFTKRGIEISSRIIRQIPTDVIQAWGSLHGSTKIEHFRDKTACIIDEETGAPELLAALENIIAISEEPAWPKEHISKWVDKNSRAEHAMRLARAAIARTKGE